MKIVLLGLLFCEQSLERTLKKSKCGVQYAPHKFQSNLVSGFEQLDEVDLHVINVPPTGSFPINSKELFSSAYSWGKNKQQISFVNLPIVKHFEQEQKLFARCCNIVDQTDETVFFICYSPYPPFLNVCNRLKRKYGNVRCTLIQTDPIPGKGDIARFMNKRAVRKGEQILKKTKSFDSFVVLTRDLCETLEVGDRPYTVVECICDGGQAPSKQTDGSKHIVMYAGTLEEEYGILDVAKAFINLPEAEFWIYGRGSAEQELRKLSQQYTNIRFFGFADNATIAEARDQCDFLINPRRPTGTFTRYSFPSKTVEYMMSAKPVLMYKLEGVPDEYDEYLNYLTGSTDDAIGDELKNIFMKEYSELLYKAEKGRQFILEKKHPKVQADKIVKLLG